jgi:putative methyltransferase (TIGR04325 family)
VSVFLKKSSWEQAKKDSRGYSDPNLLEGYISEFKLNPVWNKDYDNMLFDSRTISALNSIGMILLLTGQKEINVCDIGGGNGELAFAVTKKFNFIKFEWNIFETKEISHAYEELSNHEKIKWSEYKGELDEIYDIIILSSSLHYFDEPYELLTKIEDKCKFLMVLRLPLIDSNHDIPAVQNGVNNLGVKVSVPYWFLSQTKFDGYLENFGDIVLKWEQREEIVEFEGQSSTMQGRLIRTKKS